MGEPQHAETGVYSEDGAPEALQQGLTTQAGIHLPLGPERAFLPTIAKCHGHERNLGIG